MRGPGGRRVALTALIAITAAVKPGLDDEA
jgi:hypothetical protein